MSSDGQKCERCGAVVAHTKWNLCTDCWDFLGELVKNDQTAKTQPTSKWSTNLPRMTSEEFCEYKERAKGVFCWATPRGQQAISDVFGR